MKLFNASSIFNEEAAKEMLEIVHSPEKLQEKVVDIKQTLLKIYNFKAYNIPDDFTTTSYVIAANHLTDSDAPLIMSFYYELMRPFTSGYPALFVFAKENCFNGVSVPTQFTPVFDLEKVVPVDRNSLGGSKAAMTAAKRWFAEGEKPKHFLIFAQGTIYDINKDNAEDIEAGAFWLSRMLGIPVLPAFIEQAVEGAENRLVFGQPFAVPKNQRNFDDYKQLWLDRVIEAQNSLQALAGAPARQAVLDEAHQTRKRFRQTSDGEK